MFQLRKTERAAFESHIADLKEEIYWLRSCIPWVAPVGSTARSVGASAAPPPLVVEPQPVDEQDDLVPRGPLAPLTEQEEDILDALQRGDLDKEEAHAILKALDSAVEIEFK